MQTESLEQIVTGKIEQTFDGVDLNHFHELYSLVVKPSEKAIISYVMKRVGGNQVHAARYLGINRNTLRKKAKLYGLIGKEAAT